MLYQLSYVCVQCSYNMSVQEDASELVDLILDGEIDPAELRKGTKDEEKEHDMSPAKARKTAKQHLTRVDAKYYTKTEKCLGEDGPCQHCGPNYEGRAAELAQLGWQQRGWSDNAQWMNPSGSYFVHDHILDQLPEDEWAYIKAATNARSAADVAIPQPQSRTLGDYELSRKLASMDDRADQEKAKDAARSYLKNRPKAQVIGDQTTIGL